MLLLCQSELNIHQQVDNHVNLKGLKYVETTDKKTHDI